MSAGLPMRLSIGPYRVIDLVGAGGMGTVYRVAHRATGQIAAAKLLNAGAMGSTALERFRNEARIHQTLAHPCIASMHEFLEVDGVPCLVMEYVDGETLEEHLRQRGPLQLRESLRIFGALSDAVGYMHQRGIVHRDLKTNNVKLSSQGVVKLLDFGIATAAGSPRLTGTGNVVGTLMCLSPEQLRTGRAEPRSDIWALGILFYEMLTGRAPFEGEAPGLLTERILNGSYLPPSEVRPELPREVDRIVARCLRVRPEDRYATAEALLTELRTLQTGGAQGGSAWRPPQLLIRSSGELATAFARQWRLMASVGAAAVALLFFAWSVWPSPTPPPHDPPRPPEVVRDTPTQPGEGSGLAEVPGLTSSVTPSVTHRVTPGLAPRDSMANPDAMTRRRVIIRVLEGPTDIYINGVRVGVTPYTLDAPIGAEMSILLKRIGCDDFARTLRVEEGMSEFVESLRHCRVP